MVTWDAQVYWAWSPKNFHQIKHNSQLLGGHYFLSLQLPDPGIIPTPPAVEEQSKSPNHLTVREFPYGKFPKDFIKTYTEFKDGTKTIYMTQITKIELW